MKGDEPLIDMRMKGSIPSSVWIDTDEDKLESWRYWLSMNNQHASVQLEPGDRHPDMRYVIGLPCYIQGSDSKAVFKARDACIEAKASRVIAMVMEKHGRGEMMAFRVVEVTDTAGQQTFKAKTTEAAIHG